MLWSCWRSAGVALYLSSEYIRFALSRSVPSGGFLSGEAGRGGASENRHLLTIGVSNNLSEIGDLPVSPLRASRGNYLLAMR